ncbi:hypothetical protein QJQ45_013723 [Haematococcus lacustris]|nr:hypothetical protein QJQ45_013723 [Haematococcus lacustris]
MAGRGYGGRGGAGFARPENALKRAEELENVGQKGNALQVLHDIITSKKHRTWSKTYETIMFKHIDLVVDMKKRNYGKEALMQYRNMCQAVNIASLEEVIKYYLKKASDKAEEAQSKAAAVTIDVADLEEDASPEDIMLSYVSGDKSKDRTDRELVTPWFRFLWEAYRSVLEILRTNPKLEPVYAMTANKAFHFCLQFKRTAEFRRLCDILRQHLTNSTNRYREAPTAESLQLHMDTRFEQLKVACDLEMWAEAFRSVEDIQSLILLQKKSPKQQSMATYYARLTQIFAVSENHLYNAYAWLKLFNFSRSFNKNMTPADFQAMSSSVLLAMLSILPYDVKQGQALDEMAVDQEKERILRMANILGYQVDANKDYRTVLSRAALLSSVGAVNVLALVPPEIRQIHELLTSEFAPLELCRRMAPLLAKLGETTHSMSASSPVKEVALGQYVNQLKQVTVLRLLKQLSEVFSSLKISTLESLVPFMPLSEVEAVVVDAVKCEYLQMHIDHRQGTLHFGSQQLESEQVCSHLQVRLWPGQAAQLPAVTEQWEANGLLSQRLSKAVAMERAGAVSAAQAAKKAEIVALALENTEALHSLAHARKLMIEKRKEDAENALLEAERESQRLREQQEQDAARLAERRAKEDALRREKDRIEAELQEQEKQELMAMMEARMKSGKVGSKLAAVMKGAEGKELDRDTILREAQAERLKEQQELERKMTKVARQLDHLERARREEEAPVLARLAAEREAEERALYEESVRQEAVRHRAGWEQDMADRVRILKTLDDKAVFEAQVIARRREEFEEYRRQQLAKQAQRRAQRRAEITSQRIERFLEQCRKEVAVRVADIEAEEAARLKEEKKKQEEERLRKLQEIAEQQRKREAEIEAKTREQNEALRTAPAAGKFVPPSMRARMAGAGAPDAPPAPAAVDRWTAPSRRDDPPPPRAAVGGGGERPNPFGAARPTSSNPFGAARPKDEAPPAAKPAAGPAPGKFVPPHLRKKPEMTAKVQCCMRKNTNLTCRASDIPVAVRVFPQVVKRPSHISASAKKLCHGCKYSKSGVLQLRALFDEVE